MLKKANDIYFLFIIRNPLSVISSWLNAPKEFRKDLGWIDLNEWRYAPLKNLDKPEEFNGYEKWKESTNLFIKLKNKYPSNVFLIKYAELLSNTYNVTQNIFNFLDLNIELQTSNFITNQKFSNNPYSTYRKNQNDNKWKSLNPIIINTIKEDLVNTDLEFFIS